MHQSLAAGLASIAQRMPTAEAVRVLDEALEHEPDSPTRMNLATGLSSIADRMEPAQAAEAAKVLITAIRAGKNSVYLHSSPPPH